MWWNEIENEIKAKKKAWRRYLTSRTRDDCHIRITGKVSKMRKGSGNKMGKK